MHVPTCQKNESKKYTEYHQILHISRPKQSRTIVVFHPNVGYSKRLHNMENKVHLPQSSQQTLSCTKGTLEYGGTNGLKFRLTIIPMLFSSSPFFSFCGRLITPSHVTNAQPYLSRDFQECLKVHMS